MITTFSKSISFPFSRPNLIFLLSSIQSSIAQFSSNSDHPFLKLNRPTYLSLLKTSSSLPSHHLGTSLHAHILKSGFQDDVFIATALINMLSSFSDVDSARNLFDQMPKRDVAVWNSMLSGYSRSGYVDQALSLFRLMGSFEEDPNSLTLSVLLQVCSGCEDKRLGRSIHAYLFRHLELEDTFLDNSLLVYYNKVGDLCFSEGLFKRMQTRDVVSWNVVMSGYIRNGSPWKALDGFCLLRDDGLSPDVVTLETALQACARIGNDAICDGELIHGILVRLGHHMDVYMKNSLLLMYCNCGKMEASQSLFDTMEARNLVSWNIMVNGYVQIKCPTKAMSLFRGAFCVEREVSSDLLVSALQAVKLMGGYVKLVMMIHCLSMVNGFDSNVFVIGSIISAYGSLGEVEFARRCLDHIVSKGDNVLICWNSMLSVYVHQGFFSNAKELLDSMKLKKCSFDSITLVNVLSLCTHQLNLGSGRAVHGYITRTKLDSDVFVMTSLLELYIRCGLLMVACHLFSNMLVRNVVSWNSMIHGCLQNGFPRASLRLFYLMQQKDGLMPDVTSVVGAIEAISLRRYNEERNYIHNYAIQKGFIDDEYVANSLIAMHSRFHDFDKANLVFDRAIKLNTVTWNTMIAEYSYHGLVDKAISTFHVMKLNNVVPDSVTLLCLLQAFAGLGSLNCIMWIHTNICKTGYESDVFIGTSLINQYAKCGELSMARLIFDNISSKTVVSWNSMIQGYGVHGNVEEASVLFSQMQQSGLNPTLVTFLILISACSHAGDLEKGQRYFDLMTQSYTFFPEREHFSSYIDLLARFGLVKEAYQSLDKVLVNPGVCALGSLLGACRLHGNLEVGLAVAEKLFELDPLHCGYHALLSNMFAEAGRWMDATLIRSNVGKMGLKKVHGWSKIEIML